MRGRVVCVLDFVAPRGSTGRLELLPATISVDREMYVDVLRGGDLTTTMNYQHQESPSRPFGRLIRMLGLCPHANAGWPIRCFGEAKASQHCYDCGAQRTYLLQPSMQRGPWTRPQMGFTYRLQADGASNMLAGSAQRNPLAIF